MNGNQTSRRADSENSVGAISMNGCNLMKKVFGDERLIEGFKVIRFTQFLMVKDRFSSIWHKSFRLVAFVILTSLACFLPGSSQGADDEAESWKPIWSFTIPRLLEEKRWGKFWQQEPGIAILPDGRTYLREGKIYDFATNKQLVEVAASKKDGETADKDSGGLFAFNPAGKDPKKPEKFDPGSDFESPGGLAKPDILPLSASFYIPAKGLSQPVVIVQGTTIKSVGSLANLLKIPATIAEEEHNWCFISQDQKRIVLGTGLRERPKLTYIEFDPKTQTEIRRKTTSAPFQVERVRFVEDSPNVVLIARKLALYGGINGAAIWNTKEIVARPITIDLTKPDVKVKDNRSFGQNYSIEMNGKNSSKSVDVSPNGKTIAIVEPQIDSRLDTNIIESRIADQLKSPFFGLLLIYDVTQQKQQEHRFTFGASGIRFVDNKTIMISYFDDPRKAENRENDTGWRSSPRGNNGLAIFDLETKKLSILRMPSDNLLANDIIYLDTAGGSLIAVHDTPQEIRVEGLSRIQSFKPLLSSNVANQHSSPFMPLFDDTTYFYEAKKDGNIYNYKRTIGKLSGENGEEWVMQEEYSTSDSEQRRAGYIFKKIMPPFPIFTQEIFVWSLNVKQGFLNRSLVKYIHKDGFGTKKILGNVKIMPISMEKNPAWENEFMSKEGYQSLNGWVGLNYTDTQKCNAKSENSNEKVVMVVERQITRIDDKRPDKVFSTIEMQEKYQKGLGLVEIADSTGLIYTLKHIRSASKELPGHPMECTLYEGKETVSNTKFMMAFHSFKDGKFRGLFYSPAYRPCEFDGEYDEDRIKWSHVFDPNQAASGFEGVFKKTGTDQIIGKFNLVQGQKVIKTDYKANRIY